MPFFKSSREKRYWLYAFMVLLAILSTLALGRPLQDQLRDQNVQAVFFLIGMALTGAAILVHALKTKISRTELVIWFGLAAVYIMFIFRLGAPERSHLLEYSVLAIFIHKALIERFEDAKRILRPALIAFVLTAFIGVFDEGIQLFLPNRVFDPNDMIFNGFSAFSAIGCSTLLQWLRKMRKKQDHSDHRRLRSLQRNTETISLDQRKTDV